RRREEWRLRDRLEEFLARMCGEVIRDIAFDRQARQAYDLHGKAGCERARGNGLRVRLAWRIVVRDHDDRLAAGRLQLIEIDRSPLAGAMHTRRRGHPTAPQGLDILLAFDEAHLGVAHEIRQAVERATYPVQVPNPVTRQARRPPSDEPLA